VKSILRIYRMWRTATYIFQKMYYKKKSPPHGRYTGGQITYLAFTFSRSGGRPSRYPTKQSFMYN
jgi:hypothetical protein